MSFAAQEQALFDLLFDRDLRAAFLRDGTAALARYGFDEQERRDFAVIRPAALEMDANARVNFILAQYCRSFPLAFALVSSLPGGLDRLRSLVDAALMRTPPAERLGAFGVALRDGLAAGSGLADAQEQALVMSIVEAELGMAWTAQLARQASLRGEVSSPAAGELPSDWLAQPVRIAPLTSAAILPQPHAVLKRELCPCTGSELWRHLTREPLDAARRRSVLARRDLRLLVARASIARQSPCEPEVEHLTVELGEGFARLLPHLDGRTTLGALLAQLRAAGADEAMLAGVTHGFRELWQNGMLEPLTAHR